MKQKQELIDSINKQIKAGSKNLSKVSASHSPPLPHPCSLLPPRTWRKRPSRARDPKCSSASGMPSARWPASPWHPAACGCPRLPTLPSSSRSASARGRKKKRGKKRKKNREKEREKGGLLSFISFYVGLFFSDSFSVFFCSHAPASPCCRWAR